MANPLVTGFRSGLAKGELLVQKCESCGKFNMYPRHACPFCQSFTLGWHRASGRGRLKSFTVLRAGAPEGFETDLPYGIGIVQLEEGVQMLCRLTPGANGDWNGYACEDVVEFIPASPEEVERRPCAWFHRAGI